MKIKENIIISLSIVAFIWGIFFIDTVLPVSLWKFGIRPRQIDGLIGLVFSPFLHGGLPHLLANSGALFVLLTCSLIFSRPLTVAAVFIIGLVGGGGVWLFGGSNTVHIGASGIIFGLIGFLLFFGIFRRQFYALLISLLVLIFYGGSLFTLLLYLPGISWTGHAFGFLSGILAAWITRNHFKKE